MTQPDSHHHHRHHYCIVDNSEVNMENMADNHSDPSDKKNSDLVENEEQKPLLTKTKKTKKVSPHTKKVLLLLLICLHLCLFSVS